MSVQTALQKTESLSLQTARELDIPLTKLQLVRDTIAKGATEEELSLFLYTAHRTGLDAMARQIFAVKRWDSSLKREAMSIQISIDGFRLIADRTNKYVPGREPSFTYDKNGNLESATAYVKKFVGGIWHEISATAFYTEYVQTTKENAPNRMWAKMPRLMLAKTAESLVLRKAFPAELSGLYTVEEMGTDAPDLPPANRPPTKTQLVEEMRNTVSTPTAPQNLSPEEQKLRDQIGELCEQGGKSQKFLDLALNKFDSFKTFEEKENAVAVLRTGIEGKERETLLEAVKNTLAERAWEEGEMEAFFIEHEIESGIDDLSLEQLRGLQLEFGGAGEEHDEYK